MNMIALFLSLVVRASNPSCETVGPRLDGTYVTVCSGHVTRVTDKQPTGPYTYLSPSSR